MHSLRSKIFLLVVCILVLVAAGVMLFSKRDVEDAMLSVEHRSARNVLHLLELNLAGRWQTMLLDKVDAVQDVKRSIRQISGMVLSGLEPFRDMAAGPLDERQARAKALDWLAGLKTDGIYCFVLDGQGRVLFHPNPGIVGTDFSTLRDIKGRPLVEAARKDVRRFDSAIAIFRFSHPERGGIVKQYANFVSVPEWDWLVGVAAFIGDVEEHVTRKRNEILDVMRENTPKIRIAESGFVFLFNAQGRVLISPSEAYATRLASATVDGRPLLDKLKRMAKRGDESSLNWELPSNDGRAPLAMESLVTRFAPLNLYIATAAPRSEIARPAQELLKSQGVIVAGVLVLALAVALAFSSRISRPLARLASYAKSLPDEDFTSPEPPPPAIADLPERHRDEVGRLARAFIFMEASLRENIAGLMRMTAAKERIESELAIAREIQMGLLPKDLSPLAGHPEITLQTFLQPAKEVGGDLYDFFLLDDGRLCFSVGDVSDKGVPAALFMAVTQTLLRTAARDDPEPASMLRTVNEELARENPKTLFVTLLVAVMDLDTGAVAYANAGHNPPLLIRGREVEAVRGISGPVAGAIEGLDYAPLRLQLLPGDTLLLFTDGVTEAMNEGGELYSDARLARIVQANAAQQPETIVKRVLADVQTHAAGALQSDDITMLCLRYNGRETT